MKIFSVVFLLSFFATSVFAASVSPSPSATPTTKLPDDCVVPQGFTAIRTVQDFNMGPTDMFLCNDIYGFGAPWPSLSGSNIRFEGNKKKISGFKLTRPLFYELSRSSVKNLTLENMELNTDSDTFYGAIAYEAFEVTFENIKVYGNRVTGSHPETLVAGITTRAWQTNFINVQISGLNLNSNTSVGGLVVSCTGCVIRNSMVSGTLKGKIGVGGLVGSSEGTKIINSDFVGYLSGVSYVGGIAGTMTDGLEPSILESVRTFGFVEGTGSVGGLVGSVYYNPGSCF